MVRQPNAQQKPTLGWFANFSTLPESLQDFAVWSPTNDVLGCDAFDALPLAQRKVGNGSQRVAVVVRRGNCTFLQKALNAQSAGAAGLVVVWDSDSVRQMTAENTSMDALGVNIFVVSLPKAVGEQLLATNASLVGEDAALLSVSVYRPLAWDLSEAVMVISATALVAMGAFVATADLRPGSPLAPPAEEGVLEFDCAMAAGLCAVGSCTLVALYFLLQHLIYFVIGVFCLGGLVCMTMLAGPCLQYALPLLSKQLFASAPVTFGDLVAFAGAAAVVLGWLQFRNSELGWIFQDCIGATMLFMSQRTLRLPSVRVAVLLLSLMFFYDIFWVFLSPFLFKGKSVMAEVATGGSTGQAMPMVLRIPPISDPVAAERILGFGDIVMPGLLASYLLRHDTENKKTGRDGYFLPCLVGYAAGMTLTLVALRWMQRAQPALLYLVPTTLGPFLLLSLWRRELSAMWSGQTGEAHVKRD